MTSHGSAWFGCSVSQAVSGRATKRNLSTAASPTTLEVETWARQLVVKREDGWAIRGERNERDTSRHPTQAAAPGSARDIARNQQSEVVIHDRQGRIRDRDSYGNDPRPPIDRRH